MGGPRQRGALIEHAYLKVGSYPRGQPSSLQRVQSEPARLLPELASPSGRSPKGRPHLDGPQPRRDGLVRVRSEGPLERAVAVGALHPQAFRRRAQPPPDDGAARPERLGSVLDPVPELVRSPSALHAGRPRRELPKASPKQRRGSLEGLEALRSELQPQPGPTWSVPQGSSPSGQSKPVAPPSPSKVRAPPGSKGQFAAIRQAQSRVFEVDPAATFLGASKLNPMQDEALRRVKAAAEPEAGGRYTLQEEAWRFATLARVTGASKKEKELAVRLRQAEEEGEEPASQSVGLASRREARDTREGSKNSRTSTDKELAKIRLGFRRFQVPHTTEMRKEDLDELAQFMGLPVRSVEEVEEVGNQVTPYSDMDITEVVSFVEAYTRREHQRWRTAFNALADEETSTISRGDAQILIRELGFNPLAGVFEECMQSLDQDNQVAEEYLDYYQFMRLVDKYCSTDGFTREEVGKFRHSFEKFCRRDDGGNKELDTMLLTSIVEALLLPFGAQVKQYVNKLIGELHGGSGMQAVGPERMDFAEYLTFSRRIQQEQHASYIREFQRHVDLARRRRGRAPSKTKDGSPGLPVKELQATLDSLGYETSTTVCNEILEDEEELMDIKELNLEEFFVFMHAFKKRDGFMQGEADALDHAFRKFDPDGDKEIAVSDLGALMRHLGYSMRHDALAALCAAVDVDDNKSLDMTEYRWLMRTHRTNELKRLKAAFKQFKEGPLNVITFARLPAALKAIDGRTPSQQLIDRAQQKAMHQAMMQQLELMRDREAGMSSSTSLGQSLKGGTINNTAGMLFGLNFDGLISVVDECRRVNLVQGRQNAGFREQEIQTFRALFNEIDRDQDGKIDGKHFMHLLNKLQLNCKSNEQKQALRQQLNDARRMAREAGAHPASLTAEHTIEVNFWELVQLLRILKDRQDQEKEEDMHKLAQKLRFTNQELDQFREVFISWSQFENSDEARSVEPVSPKHGQKRRPVDEDAEEEREGISPSTMYRLLRTMGMSMTPPEKEKLERKAVQEAESKSAGAGSAGLISFIGFLRLMRWLLDSDFAGINGIAADVAEKTGRSGPSVSRLLH